MLPAPDARTEATNAKAVSGNLLSSASSYVPPPSTDTRLSAILNSFQRPSLASRMPSSSQCRAISSVKVASALLVDLPSPCLKCGLYALTTVLVITFTGSKLSNVCTLEVTMQFHRRLSSGVRGTEAKLQPALVSPHQEQSHRGLFQWIGMSSAAHSRSRTRSTARPDEPAGHETQCLLLEAHRSLYRPTGSLWRLCLGQRTHSD